LSKRHLMLKDRMELERLYGKGFGAAEIATKLKVHRSTVYNELKRGDTGEMDENGRSWRSRDFLKITAREERREPDQGEGYIYESRILRNQTGPELRDGQLLF